MQVWFLGKADVQKIKGNPHLQKTNYGYDDERGDYQVVNSDHIAYRYEVQGVLGKGSFGQVLKVLDYKTGTYKALKVIRNKKRFHHQVCVGMCLPMAAAAGHQQGCRMCAASPCCKPQDALNCALLSSMVVMAVVHAHVLPSTRSAVIAYLCCVRSVMDTTPHIT